MTRKEKIIKKIIDTVLQDVRDKIENLINIAFDEWDIKDLEKVISERDI